MTSSDSYTMTEQVKKKVLLGGRGGGGGRLEGGEINQYHHFIFSNQLSFQLLLVFTQSFCFY